MTETVDVPKYYRLKQELLTMIEGATAGTLIPPERELAKRFATSRTTVRQALAELVAEGTLDRVQGRGTFVAPPKLTQVRQLTSFSEDLVAQGRVPSSRVLRVDRIPADDATAEQLGLPAGSRVHRVERLRYSGDEPLAHETAHLPGSLPRLRAQLARTGSLYTTLRDAYGIDITDVEDSIETALAAPEEAHLLGVEVGTPLLLVHRLAREASGRPVEWTRSAFRGDRFRFVARTRRG